MISLPQFKIGPTDDRLRRSWYSNAIVENEAWPTLVRW